MPWAFYEAFVMVVFMQRFIADPKNVFFRCVEDCNEAIMVTDLTGALVYVNPAWQRLYGFTRAETMGKTPRLLHSGHQSADFYRQMWAAIMDNDKGSWKGELINRAKDGRLVPVLLTITPFRNPDEEEIVGHMGIALDLTYRKELEQKVVHQDRLASIGLLASGLAHEVGTPLGVIRGRAEFHMMTSQNAQLSKDLGVIVGQIDRISSLIRSLLRVSRGFGDIRIEPVSIRQVVEEVLALIGQNLREVFAEIRLDIPPDLRAEADYGRLEQIILNLVMNSIFAIRKSIQNGRKSGHFLEIRAARRYAKVGVEVQDSGCGIAPENMKKLFQPFFTTKDVGEGTGLGLAIVSQLLHEMRGEVSVESRVEQGTVFTIVLNFEETNQESSSTP